MYNECIKSHIEKITPMSPEYFTLRNAKIYRKIQKDVVNYYLSLYCNGTKSNYMIIDIRSIIDGTFSIQYRVYQRRYNHD